MEGTRRPLQKQGCEHLAGDNAIYQQAWDVRPPPELSYEEQAQGFLSCPHTSEMEATGELGRQLSGGSSTHLHSWVWADNMAQWVKMLAAKPEFQSWDSNGSDRTNFMQKCPLPATLTD